MKIKEFEETVNSFDFGIFDVFDAFSLNKFKIMIIFIVIFLLSIFLYFSQDFSMKKAEVTLSKSSISTSNFLTRINLDMIDYQKLYETTEYASMNTSVFEKLSNRINDNYSFGDENETNYIINSQELKKSFDKRIVEHSDIVISFTSNIQANNVNNSNPFVKNVMIDYLEVLKDEILTIYKSKVYSSIYSYIDELKKLSFDISLSITALQNGLDRKIANFEFINDKKINQIESELNIFKNTYENLDVNDEKLLFKIANLKVERDELKNADYKILFSKEYEDIDELKYLNEFIAFIIANKDDIDFRKFYENKNLFVINEELKDENRSNNENDLDNNTEFEQAKIILSEIYQSVNLALNMENVIDQPYNNVFIADSNNINVYNSAQTLAVFMLFGTITFIIISLIFIIFSEAKRKRDQYLLK
jgi:hypothetical protein